MTRTKKSGKSVRACKDNVLSADMKSFEDALKALPVSKPKTLDEELIESVLSKLQPLSADLSYRQGEVVAYAESKKSSKRSQWGVDYGVDEATRLSQLRRAAEAHRIVRQTVRPLIRPGISLSTIARIIEGSTTKLLSTMPDKAMSLHQCDFKTGGGIGFPTGLSLNQCAAHYTPNPGEIAPILTEDDILKVCASSFKFHGLFLAG